MLKSVLHIAAGPRQCYSFSTISFAISSLVLAYKKWTRTADSKSVEEPKQALRKAPAQRVYDLLPTKLSLPSTPLCQVSLEDILKCQMLI